MTHRALLLLMPMLLAPMCAIGQTTSDLSKNVVFKKDTEGHKVYRIPAMVVTTKGTN